MLNRSRNRSSDARATACVFGILALAPALAASEIPPEDLEHFETRIRPVLVERCYRCHGANPEKIRGGLVLLDAESLRAGGDSGAVIVAGSPEQSRLIEAIRYDGATEMPPDGKLPEAVIADFEHWIRRGAPDPRTGASPHLLTPRPSSGGFDFSDGREHWAFRPIAEPDLPLVEDQGWARGPLDRFVLAALEERGLRPVAAADKRTLLRRVTFDLIGLPPTEQEIEDFLSDSRPEAYAEVVDRLLASPRYGERWGRHWLDVARYADSNGLDENIAYRSAFRYRDYVIESFNEDKPYDRFVHEQIAGDLLPAGSDQQRYEQLTGTGFLMVGPKVLAEQDVDKMLIDVVDEQVNTIGRAFLAVPIGCARCHDHKFDPIPTSDYYALAGILRSTKTMSDASGMRWVERPLASQEILDRYRKAQDRLAAAKRDVEELVDEQNDLLRRPRRLAFAAYLLAAEGAYRDALPGLRATEDASAGDTEGEAAPGIAAPILAAADREGLEAPVLERLVKALYRAREWPVPEGDSANPLLAFRIWNAYAAAPASRYRELTQLLRTQIASEKLLVPPLTRSVLHGPVPDSIREVAHRYGALFATVEIAWDQHVQRLGTKSEDQLRAADFRLPPEQEELRALIYGDGLGKSFCVLCLDQEHEERLYSAEVLADLDQRRALVAEAEQALPPEPPYAMAPEEGEVVDLPVHIRGSHLNLSEKPEPRGALGVTDHLVPPPAIPDGASGRLELARWITHPAHPLTARVLVNRVWHWLFGRGIVDTPSNFGHTGSRPSHPDLLDWLARRFVEAGWSIKTLQREILLSATYRMSSGYNVENAAVDEHNLFLWRMNRKRLEAEPIRDSLLMLAGRLDLSMGGRVDEYDRRGYVFDEGSTFGKSDFYTAPRRSVYLPVVRNAIYDVFAGFDFGDASDSVGRRATTVVPSQALLMMNSPFVEEQARGFAAKLLSLTDDPERRIATAFVRAYGRPATRDEIEEGTGFLEAMRAAAGIPGSTSADRSPADEELFAWTRLCQVILAASEMIYIG